MSGIRGVDQIILMEGGGFGWNLSIYFQNPGANLQNSEFGPQNLSIDTKKFYVLTQKFRL